MLINLLILPLALTAHQLPSFSSRTHGGQSTYRYHPSNTRSVINQPKLEACTLDDVRVGYGECRPNGTRTVFFQYVPTCDNTSSPVLHTRYNSSCDFSCQEGQYYDAVKQDCFDCPAGTTSEYYALTYSDWPTIPKEFKLHTVNDAKPWEAFGSSVHAPALKLFQETSMSLDVDIHTPSGNVSFKYECFDDERGEVELVFLIDGVEKGQNLYSSTFSVIHFPLSFGKHTLTWLYRSNTVNDGPLDGARVTDIRIVGAHYLVSHCVKCPTGSYSTEGKCMQCPRGTYSKTPGASKCETCEKGKWSQPGSTECQDLPRCLPTDYTATYGECEMIDGEYKRMRTFKWIEPLHCNPDHPWSKPLPKASPGPCPRCGPGQFRKAGICSACPQGSFRTGEEEDESQCQRCASGSIAPPAIVVSAGSKIIKGSTTKCVSDRGDPSDCATDGWMESHLGFTSGVGHSGPVQSILVIPLNITTKGVVSFHFSTHLQNTSYFKFHTTSSTPTVVNSSLNGNISRADVKVTNEDTNITFIFLKTRPSTSPAEEDYIDIYQITINGAQDAHVGGTRCDECQPGTMATSQQDSCSDCPPGTFSKGNASSCSPCLDGTYTSWKGSEMCRPCGKHTDSADNFTTCKPKICGFKHNDTHSFDLSSLRIDEGMHGPFDAQKSQSRYSQFYFDFCSTGLSDVMCLPPKQSFLSNDEKNKTKKTVVGKIKTYACEIDGETVKDLGNKMEFDFFERIEKKMEYGVNVTFYDGSLCFKTKKGLSSNAQTERVEKYFNKYGIVTPSLSNTSQILSQDEANALVQANQASLLQNVVMFSTQVLLKCNPDVPVGRPVPVSLDMSNCSYSFLWETAAACRSCRKEDFDTITTDCIKSQQKVRSVKKGSSQCFGGYVPDAEIVQSCKSPYVKLGALETILVVAIVLVVIVGGIIIICLLRKKNKTLQFQLLENSNRQIEKEGGTSMFDEDGDKQ
ncbi:putative Endosome/lysosome-associated apoptosis and autophagy regulator 1 [Blattamonas nauphoetae]|uniref:Endosome/lysosome-associated apoptosis and autophagy regulator 1 n=1 Tax=Blattamonas nauphoetae TaxID=2049346 RepID=A0ABQ9Y0F1_9EUKA|nr:putative Endosome/lysosome-associated apoptosis and autophagy regulator 1 [Blattamonas nauphoetae]